FIERPISIELIRIALVFAPKPIAAAAYVPIGKRVDKFDDPLGGRVIVIGVHPLNDDGHGAVQFAEHPAVEFGTVGNRAGFRTALRRKSIDVGVDDKEAVRVPELQEEFGDAVFYRPFTVANGRPRRLRGEEVPAQSIGAVLLENLPRLAIVPLT